jgi:hypothetical protein
MGRFPGHTHLIINVAIGVMILYMAAYALTGGFRLIFGWPPAT